MTATIRAAVFTMLIFAAPARAQDCPGARGNDECDRMVFEQADAALTQAVEKRLADITRKWSPSPRAEAAKSLFSVAHREWLRFREAECEAYAAEKSLRSARTPVGLGYACRGSLTRLRIEEISRY
jgi:uncharacterized protein YecT (DUF1311 family)